MGQSERKSNPAFEDFAASINGELTVMQVLARRQESRFTLRHAADRNAEESALRLLTIDQLREMAQTTAANAFRPLKSAPNLRSGWRAAARDAEELGHALNQIYPGAVADWHAERSGVGRITSFREFTERQTGMYRITAKLTDAQASMVINACCGPEGCLKRRCWTVGALEPDSAEAKGVIPCLEPCPLFLEFARKAMRIEQEEKTPFALSASDAETLRAALETAAASAPGPREADFADAMNPRRIRLALARLNEAESMRPRSNPPPE